MSPEAIQLLVDLARRGGRIVRAGDRLRLMPKAAVTPELIERARRLKGELLPQAGPGLAAALFGTVNEGWLPDPWAANLRRSADCCEPYHPDWAGPSCGRRPKSSEEKHCGRQPPREAGKAPVLDPRTTPGPDWDYEAGVQRAEEDGQ